MLFFVTLSIRDMQKRIYEPERCQTYFLVVCVRLDVLNNVVHGIGDRWALHLFMKSKFVRLLSDGGNMFQRNPESDGGDPCG